MKLLLTPAGLSDFVVERIPRVTGLIPCKQHVIVLVCNDGKGGLEGGCDSGLLAVASATSPCMAQTGESRRNSTVTKPLHT